MIVLCNSVRAVFVCVLFTPLRPSVGWRFFTRQPKPVLTLRMKFTIRQSVRNGEISNCSSSNGFGPTLMTMTKLFAILTNLSANFPTTVCGTFNLFHGHPRSHILRCPQSGVLFAVFCCLRGMSLCSCWVLARCSSCNRLRSLFARAKSGR